MSSLASGTLVKNRYRIERALAMIRLARGTADAVVAGSAELERYPREKKVLVLDPERMTRKTFDRAEAITRASDV